MLATGLALAACSDEPGTPAVSGEAEYRRYCATCHDRDGTGRPPNFPPLAGSEWLAPGPEAAALIALVGLRGEIEVAGETYRGLMPKMRQVDDDKMVRLLGYIDARWANWETLPDESAIARLRRLTDDQAALEGRDDLDALLERVSP